ncbi:hypothetical protein BLOT_005017 [Blomia tropicalis]|nr:hypothetical protein BLOT_005017 [Blomia tropicalis]
MIYGSFLMQEQLYLTQRMVTLNPTNTGLNKVFSNRGITLNEGSIRSKQGASPQTPFKSLWISGDHHSNNEACCSRPPATKRPIEPLCQLGQICICHFINRFQLERIREYNWARLQSQRQCKRPPEQATSARRCHPQTGGQLWLDQ